MPAAIRSGAGQVYRLHAIQAPASAVRDWREWRANEFMVAFLMPPAMAAKVVPQVAGEIGAGLRWVHPRRAENAVPSVAHQPFDVIEAVVLGVAERFGVSPDFAAVRLRRYAMIGRAQ